MSGGEIPAPGSAPPCGRLAPYQFDSGAHISSKSFLPLAGELEIWCGNHSMDPNHTAYPPHPPGMYPPGVSDNGTDYTDLPAPEIGSVNANRIWVYGAPLIIVLGLIGNTLSIIVMRRPGLRKMTASTYLTVLAGADSAVLLLGLLRFWLIEMYNIDFRTLTVVTCKLHTSAIYFAFQFEAWLLVSVTFERFIAVCRPIHYQTIFTKFHVYVGLLVMGLVFALINSHFLWTYQLLVHGNYRWCYFDAHAQFFIMHVWPWFDLILASLLPFTLMLYMNATISFRLLRRRQRRRNVTSSSRSNKHDNSAPAMTVMLLFVTFIFVILSLPFNVYFVIIKGLVQDVDSYVPEDQERVHMIHACTSLLAYSNYAINFLLYCIGGKRFRAELHSLCNDIANNCSSRAAGNGHVNMVELFEKNFQQEESTKLATTGNGESSDAVLEC